MPAQETALLCNYEDSNCKNCSTAVMLVFPKTQRNIGLAEPPLLPQAPLASAGWWEGGLRVMCCTCFHRTSCLSVQSAGV